MSWKHLLAGVLGLALSAPAFAEDEEFPEGPKPDEKEVMPGSEEEANEEEQIDVVGTLEGIIGKMKDAEDILSKAGSWRATDDKGNPIEDMDRLIKAQDLQKKAIEEMTRIFSGSKNNQQAAIEDIEKLIKAAKEGD